VKLLFDHNLSFRLPGLLRDLFPGSIAIREVKLSTAKDSEVWNFARLREFVVITKDSDFRYRSLLHGAPPKIIWIATGNCSTQTIAICCGTDLLKFRRSRMIREALS
jgi:predicted nuclease of predicted toxin-antitoxin system